MKMTYDRLNTDELHGTTQADYLISLDAHFRLIDGALTIFDEPGFPVVELARSLLFWLGGPDGKDFEFDSMSCEEVGTVAVRLHATGWTVESVWAPGRSTSPLSRTEVDRSCREFVSRVASDLRALRINPDEVLRL